MNFGTILFDKHRIATRWHRLARLVGRVVEHALRTVTNDVLMKYSQSLRANGSDQGEKGAGEGVKHWGKGADLPPPCVSSLASPHRPLASDGSLEPSRREYL